MSIRISEQHGVNPSLEQCFYCGEAKGVILFGRMKGDREAPRQVCLDHEPCDKCRRFMEQGIILIGVDEAKSDDEKNPYRDGKWCVVTEDYVHRVFKKGDLLDSVLKRRCAFLGSETWSMLGLPTPRLGGGATHKGSKLIEEGE